MHKRTIKWLLLCAALILFVGVITGQPFDFFTLGQKTSHILQNSPSNTSNTLSDSNIITQRDIDLLRLKKDFLQLDDSEDEMVNKLLRQRIIFQEAERLNLTISHAEAKERVIDIMNQAEKLTQSANEAERTSAEQTLSFINSYIDGLGITQDEYFDLAAEEQREIEAAAALQSYFKDTLATETANDPVLFEEAWNKYVDELVEAFQNNAMPQK
ncbi:MAG TPA: hypothetical protein IAB00_00240 [Candidatus Avidehalobacter gallistercoris]|uniref:Uncharacterized protein n=1 Tax=Candidatus Avidehalobacter gallistercoris TaxID=2840694 RepID=A0A9D1KXV7_9FIRM|nr:hypothetical protein [Candidatus Avidehalobacter gallistercoris]